MQTGIENEVLEHLNKIADRCCFKRHSIGCVILDRNGEIQTDGWAHNSHVVRASATSLHAEMHAIGRGRHRDMAGCIAVVLAKSKKSGNMVLGKPCLACAIGFRGANIFDVLYSTPKGKFEYLDLERSLLDLKIYRLERRKHENCEH